MSERFLATLSPTEVAFFEGNLFPQKESATYEAIPFSTKDSGQRTDLANGMVRDVEDNKVDWTLVLDGPLLARYAELLTRGAKKYGAHNWTRSFSAPPGDSRRETKERFRRSAMRHFMQWLNGELDEDHAAAVVFNLNGYEAMGGAGRE